MKENLLVLTTAGTLKWLKEAMDTLRDPLDVLVVDDSTPKEIGIEAFCKKEGIYFLTKPEPRGLTNSWNAAYQFFKEHNYTNCILSNDDVRFPAGFSNGLIAGLSDKSDYAMIGPFSNAPGKDYLQQISKFIEVEPTSENVDQIQKIIWEKDKSNGIYKQTKFINGFCFAFSQSMEKFKFSKEFLCDPSRINVGNDTFLCSRIWRRGGKSAVCRTSYVFHWKNVTFKAKGQKRNRLWR